MEASATRDVGQPEKLLTFLLLRLLSSAFKCWCGHCQIWKYVDVLEELGSGF